MLRIPIAAALMCLPLAVGCGGSSTDTLGTNNDALSSPVLTGARLFNKETFKGNGRTCATCHTAGTGTINPSQVAALYNRDPSAALFRSIDSDDGQGNSYSRLINDATIRVTITLPPNISLADDPTARTVTVNRGIPTTLDTPALDNVFQLDGRQPTLQSQALGAIHDHAQGGREPTQTELNDIAKFEKTQFSSWRTFFAAVTGDLNPAFPKPITAAQKRGAAFFTDGAACGICHSPNVTQFGGFRFSSIGVSEVNEGGNAVRPFIVTGPDGSQQEVDSPDPGRMLITGDPADANAFKVPLLWNVKNTAPYFHDNSAKTLDDVLNHYDLFLPFMGFPALSPQDKSDLKAYMNMF